MRPSSLPLPLSPSLVDERHRMNKEQSLLMHARDGIQLLVNQIWSRPTRVVDEGLVAELPPISTGLPREKPVRPASLLSRIHPANERVLARISCPRQLP